MGGLCECVCGEGVCDGKCVRVRDVSESVGDAEMGGARVCAWRVREVRDLSVQDGGRLCR